MHVLGLRSIDVHHWRHAGRKWRKPHSLRPNLEESTMTTQFHHINLCAKDPTDLENFYKDVLELAESNAYTGNQKQITNQGYGGRVAFLTDGKSEMHLSTLDLNVAFRTKQPINPLERGHIAFRTDDIEGIK